MAKIMGSYYHDYSTPITLNDYIGKCFIRKDEPLESPSAIYMLVQHGVHKYQMICLEAGNRWSDDFIYRSVEQVFDNWVQWTGHIQLKV